MYTPTGRIVADSGFQPKTDGFSFENYPPPDGLQGLAPAQMVDIFGSDVCASQTDGVCALTPVAQDWMTKENAEMQGGHCFGFSLTSLLMFGKELDPLSYGGASVPALSLDNLPLQEAIGESFVLQNISTVKDEFIEETPNRVLADLVDELRTGGDAYTLGMFNRVAGHAITPYAVEDKGNGVFAALAYDNNFPGITRAVIFNRRTNSWRYDGAANPAQGSFIYGGRGSRNRPLLIPTDAVVQLLHCPFCSTLGTSKPTALSTSGRHLEMTPPGYEEISLTADSVNHGHLVITDSTGRRTGFVEGKIVNQIQGARVIKPILTRTFEEAPEPHYEIPIDADITVSLDGDPLKAPDVESITVIGSSYSAVAGTIHLEPEQTGQLHVTENGTSLTYRAGAGQAQQPHLEIGLERPGTDYRFSVAAPPIQGGSTLTAEAHPATRRLNVNAAEVKNPGIYGLAVTQLHPAGKRTAHGRTVRVRAGGSAHLSFRR